MNDKKQSIAYGLITLLKRVIIGFIILVILIVMGFLFYIGNTKNNNYENVDTVGVYNLVDSNGNVIATDLTQEDIRKIMELLRDGKDKSN